MTNVRSVALHQVSLLFKADIPVSRVPIKAVDNEFNGKFKPVERKIHQRTNKYPPPTQKPYCGKKKSQKYRQG